MKQITILTEDYNINEIFGSEFNDISFLKRISNNEVKCEITEDKEFELMIDVLATFLSSNKYLHEFETAFLKKSKKDQNDQVVLSVIQEQLEFLSSEFYFVLNAKILLKLFFKKNDIIKLESFQMFNLRSIKKEAELIADLEWENVNMGLNFIEEDQETERSQDKNKSENIDILSILKDQYDERYSEPIFKDVHIHYEDDDIVFKNEKGQILSLELIQNVLGIRLDFQGVSSKNELLLTFFDIFFIIFRAKRAVFHTDIPDNLQLIFEKRIERLKKEYEIKKYFTKGARSIL